MKQCSSPTGRHTYLQQICTTCGADKPSRLESPDYRELARKADESRAALSDARAAVESHIEYALYVWSTNMPDDHPEAKAYRLAYEARQTAMVDWFAWIDAHPEYR